MNTRSGCVWGDSPPPILRTLLSEIRYFSILLRFVVRNDSQSRTNELNDPVSILWTSRLSTYYSEPPVVCRLYKKKKIYLSHNDCQFKTPRVRVNIFRVSFNAHGFILQLL